ncbi:MAG: biotin--[acetyl-CoA-carboxylase] ligase [Alphaproteobacteria bacterium]|jgi:BirA family biotin operon repressor/biotin-[acetyl-CoA-carboxylase] ligase|nr:biotin--[acetyl-CoA-carboxylase] ligase [Alphaproteobacteria bacterium]
MSRWYVVEKEVVTSTMDEIKPLLGDHNFIALQAHIQTQGRGRRGRVWESEDGNLYLSPGCRVPERLIAHLPEWAFGVGIALTRTLKLYLPSDLCHLKWPNDLLYNGQKLAGLLVESYTDPRTDQMWAIAGVGLNVEARPTFLETKTVCLADILDPCPSLADLRDTFLVNLSETYDVWVQKGFSALRPQWLSLAHPPGTPLVVRQGTEEIYGSFVDLDLQGRLLLKKRDGTDLIMTAADVFLEPKGETP